MDIYDLQKEYYEFKWKHDKEICQKLRDEYNRQYSETHKWIMGESGFSGLVGFPLIVVWLIWGYEMKTTQEQMFPAAVLIILGIILRYYANHLITISLRNTFRNNEYRKVLVSFVEDCRTGALNHATTEAEQIEINEKFDYFAKEIEREDFRYYVRYRYEIDKRGNCRRVRY